MYRGSPVVGLSTSRREGFQRIGTPSESGEEGLGGQWLHNTHANESHCPPLFIVLDSCAELSRRGGVFLFRGYRRYLFGGRRLLLPS